MYIDTVGKGTEKVEEEMKSIMDDVRLYQIDVLFPALATASQDDRERYRTVLDSRDTVCGPEPDHDDRHWWNCAFDVDRQAAAILHIEPMVDYQRRRLAERRPSRVQMARAWPTRTSATGK